MMDVATKLVSAILIQKVTGFYHTPRIRTEV